MSNLDLLSAGLSAILGTNITSQKKYGRFSIHDLFSQTYVMRPIVEKVEGEGEFCLHVHCLSGNAHSFLVRAEETIEEIKAKLEVKEDIPAKDLRLTHGGKQLEDGRTVNIQPDETLCLVIRLRGGREPLPPTFNTDELDPEFDYAFSDVKDDGKRYRRGGFEYK